MSALAVIGCAVGGAVVGCAVGVWLGVREGGDLNLAPAFYGPIGALAGGGVGVVVGAVVFAR